MKKRNLISTVLLSSLYVFLSALCGCVVRYFNTLLVIRYFAVSLELRSHYEQGACIRSNVFT
jgi:hypothetical protein